MRDSIRGKIRGLVAFFLVSATIVSGVLGETPDDFKLIFLPDTQVYTEYPAQNNPFIAQTQWIKYNAASQNIKFVAHLGDIVQHRHTYESEWQLADQALGILESGTQPVPYSVAPGNHDVYAYYAPTYARDSSMYNQYFGVDRFEDNPWYGGHYGSTNDNNYSLFSVGDLDFLVMALEVMPSNAALNWADWVIGHYPDRRVIVTTHKYLKPDGTRYTDTIYHGISGNSGDQVFDKLVKGNPNVFMVGCGHVTEEGYNAATNDAGGTVHEVLSDYQNLTNGGNGWMRVLDFSPKFNEILIRSYSPVLDQWDLHDPFVVPYDMGGTPELPPAAALRGHWKLNDGISNPTATTAVDSSGAGDPAVLENFATPPAWEDGAIGGALRFDGSNDRVTGDTLAEIGELDSLSVSLWMNVQGRSRADTGTLIGIDEYYDSPNDAFALSIDSISSKLSFSIKPDDPTMPSFILESNAQILQDEWHHVATIFHPGQRMAIYIDGELDIELTEAVPRNINQPTATTLTIGNTDAASGVDSHCFNGLLDDVRLFSGVLSDEEIDYLASGVYVVPGDANGDGIVDVTDLGILATHYGTVGGATWAEADFTGEGTVDVSDLGILATNYGTTAAAGAVPEPSAAAILAAGLLTVILTLRRRGK